MRLPWKRGRNISQSHDGVAKCGHPLGLLQHYAGFFVLSPKCIDLIAGDQTSWEGEPLARLAAEGQLMAFEHEGFWQPMDTLREKNLLEDLWVTGRAPWKVWQ